MIEEQAARTPDQVALVFDEQELTYGELNFRANQLAQHLRGLGVGPDVLVGLYVQRSIEMVVGMLGILKAGGAYVPIDPSYPSARIALVIEDSHLGFILTTEQTRAALPASPARIISLDGDATRSPHRALPQCLLPPTKIIWRTSSTLRVRPASQKG